MKILSLDLSTSTGWATRKNGKLCCYGLIETPELALMPEQEYPFSYISKALHIAQRVLSVVILHEPDKIVIEETNLGKSLWAQKQLEFIHCAVLSQFRFSNADRIHYLSSVKWRKALGLVLSKEDRANNKYYNDSRNAEREKLQKFYCNVKPASLKKKCVGDRMRKFRVIKDGKRVTKVSTKTMSVGYVNQKYQKDFKAKDDDLADAIALAEAFEVLSK